MLFNPQAAALVAELKKKPSAVIKPGDTGDDMVLPPDPGYMNPPQYSFVNALKSSVVPR